MNKAYKEGRVKILVLDADDLLRLMRGVNGADTIRLPKLDFPEDAHVCGVEFSITHRGFLLCIAHESFTEVPMGEAAPTMWWATQQTIELRRCDLPMPRIATRQDIEGQIEYLKSKLEGM